MNKRRSAMFFFLSSRGSAVPLGPLEASRHEPLEGQHPFRGTDFSDPPEGFGPSRERDFSGPQRISVPLEGEDSSAP